MNRRLKHKAFVCHGAYGLEVVFHGQINRRSAGKGGTMCFHILDNQIFGQTTIATTQTKIGEIKIMLRRYGHFLLHQGHYRGRKFFPLFKSVANILMIKFRDDSQNRNFVKSNLIHGIGHFHVQMSLFIEPNIDFIGLKAKITEPFPETLRNIRYGFYCPIEFRRLQRNRSKILKLFFQQADKVF